MIGNFDFENGMTVKELKKIIEGWPEENVQGEPSGVWIEIGRTLSNRVIFVGQLNGTDMLFKVNAYETKELIGSPLRLGPEHGEKK